MESYLEEPLKAPEESYFKQFLTLKRKTAKRFQRGGFGCVCVIIYFTCKELQAQQLIFLCNGEKDFVLEILEQHYCHSVKIVLT